MVKEIKVSLFQMPITELLRSLTELQAIIRAGFTNRTNIFENSKYRDKVKIFKNFCASKHFILSLLLDVNKAKDHIFECC